MSKLVWDHTYEHTHDCRTGETKTRLVVGDLGMRRNDLDDTPLTPAEQFRAELDAAIRETYRHDWRDVAHATISEIVSLLNRAHDADAARMRWPRRWWRRLWD